jgi:hypothetical protein
MLLIPGVIASSYPKASGAFESIASATPNNATVVFSSIPQTYQSLQVRVMARRNTANTFGSDFLQLNNSGSSVYDIHYLEGDSSFANASGLINQTYGEINNAITGNNATASIYGVYIIDIHDYASTTKNKTVRYFAGYDLNGTGRVNVGSFLWRSTSAVTSLDFDTQTYANGSIFSLYGIKGA